MDFQKFDMRTKAESGFWLTLKNPSVPDGEELSDGPGKPCRVQVRGVASRSAQAEMRSRQKSKLLALKGKKPDDEARIMEDIHNEMCENAAALIMGFENIERGGVPLMNNREDVKFFLDLSFPLMGVVKDADGKPVRNDKGEISYELLNNPFAKQVNDCSSDNEAFLPESRTD